MNTIKTEETKITAEKKNVTAELGNGNLLSEENKEFSLPLKYWIPTLVSVVVGTTLFIWFIFSGIVSPIKNDILEIKTKGISSDKNSPIIVNTLFLESTNGTNLNANHWVQLKSVIFKLKQRKDLVLFIAGYTNDYVDDDQFQKVINSKKAAERINNILVAQGIEPARIYFDGYGQEVPNHYFKINKENVALLVIDVYELMDGSSKGGKIIRAI